MGRHGTLSRCTLHAALHDHDALRHHRLCATTHAQPHPPRRILVPALVMCAKESAVPLMPSVFRKFNRILCFRLIYHFVLSLIHI